MTFARAVILFAVAMALTAGTSAEPVFSADGAKQGNPVFTGKILRFNVLKPGDLTADGGGGVLRFSQATLGPVLTTVRQVHKDESASARFRVRRPDAQLKKLPMAAADAEKAAVRSVTTAARPVVFPVDPVNAKQP